MGGRSMSNINRIINNLYLQDHKQNIEENAIMSENSEKKNIKSSYFIVEDLMLLTK